MNGYAYGSVKYEQEVERRRREEAEARKKEKMLPEGQLKRVIEQYKDYKEMLQELENYLIEKQEYKFNPEYMKNIITLKKEMLELQGILEFNEVKMDYEKTYLTVELLSRTTYIYKFEDEEDVMLAIKRIQDGIDFAAGAKNVEESDLFYFLVPKGDGRYRADEIKKFNISKVMVDV